MNKDYILKSAVISALSACAIFTGAVMCETIPAEAKSSETAEAEKKDDIESVTMYRLYNPNSGEHFYTKNKNERDSLIKIGWNDEGIGWYAPKKTKVPVYRLYNRNGGEHHYTASKEERDALVKKSWKYEGIGWYSESEKDGIPLYRQYNPNAYSNNHNYTTSSKERDSLVNIGWHDEGTGWYGLAPYADYELPKDTWTDKEIEVKVKNRDLGDHHIEWLIDNTYGLVDWNTYVDGKLDDNGGTIRFKHAGTFEIIGRTTDDEGRTYLFEPENRFTVVQPKLGISFDIPKTVYAGEKFRLRTYGHTNNDNYLPVEYTIEKDGEPVKTEDYIEGDLNNRGGNIAFKEGGVYKLTAKMVDVDKREFSHTETIEVHPNVEYEPSIDGGSRKHIGEKFHVSVGQKYTENATVKWSILDKKGNALNWDEMTDGSLDINGGDVTIDSKTGTYTLRAVVTDQFGTETTHDVNVEIYNEAPTKPVIMDSVNFDDVQDAFTSNAKAKVTINPVSTDAFGDEITYEYSSDSAKTGYYGLGTYNVKVRAVDKWGDKSDWSVETGKVEFDKPAAPKITSTVNYDDIQNPYTDNAKAKVNIQLTNQDDNEDTQVALVNGTDGSGYYKLGSYSVKAVATNRMGLKTVSKPHEFKVEFDKPAAPKITSTVNYDDIQNPYTDNAKAKVNIELTNKDANKDTQVALVNGTDGSGYYKLGSYSVKAVATNRMGLKTVSEPYEFKVEFDKPAAPKITSTVNYDDIQNPYTDNAKAKVNVSVENQDKYSDTKVELSPDVKNTGYYGLGTYTTKAVATNRMGLKTESDPQKFEVKYNKPLSPKVNIAVDYNDVQNAYTAEAKAKVTVEAVNKDSDPSTKVSLSDGTNATGYYGLGRYKTSAVAVNKMGLKSVTPDQVFKVESQAPKTPSVEAAVDLNDIQNEFTSNAKAKVNVTLTNNDADNTVHVDVKKGSNGTGYYGLGTYSTAATAVNRMGLSTDSQPVNFTVAAKKPTLAVTIPSLNGKSSTTETEIALNAQTTADTRVKLTVIDFYDRKNIMTSVTDGAGEKTTEIKGTYPYNRHIPVTQAIDSFGQDVYDAQYFITSKDGNAGSTSAAMSMVLDENGVYDGDTPLAYIDYFDVEMPAITDHSGNDPVKVIGTKKDGTKETIFSTSTTNGAGVKSDGTYWIAGNSNGKWDGMKKDTYTKLELSYSLASGHESCLAKAQQGLEYTVKYKFIDDEITMNTLKKIFTSI